MKTVHYQLIISIFNLVLQLITIYFFHIRLKLYMAIFRQRIISKN